MEIKVLNMDTSTERSIKTSYRKEDKYTGGIKILALTQTEDGIRVNNPVDLRYYWTASTCYACLWVFNPSANTYTNGSGKAGGYGYHKESAAAAEAISEAGITLDKAIDGVGSEAVCEALRAIARAIYPDAQLHTIYSHG